MAKKTTTDETPDEQPSTNQAPGTSLASPADLFQLGQIIGDSVSRGIAQNAPPRKITIGEYNRTRGSQYHPDPKVKVKMTREYYQNGRLIEHAITFDREIELLNQITHSGRYIDRLVEVVVVQNGADEAIDIRFSNKPNFAFELKGKARDFTDMLQQIVAAQKLERDEMDDDRADRAERKTARQARSFGNGKASREAREAAGV